MFSCMVNSVLGSCEWLGRLPHITLSHCSRHGVVPDVNASLLDPMRVARI